MRRVELHEREKKTIDDDDDGKSWALKIAHAESFINSSHISHEHEEKKKVFFSQRKREIVVY